MKNRVKFLAMALSLCGLIASFSSASQPVRYYQDVHRLLEERSIIEAKALTALFSIGDERIQDLIQSLNDPNMTVRRNAQIIIRYLGNEIGMKALIDGYKKSQVYVIAGPIPLPLRDWDYEHIRTQYLKQSGDWDQSAASFIYALALDGTPNATNLLSELSAKMESGAIPYHYALQQIKTIPSGGLLRKETDVAKLVVDNAFFIRSDHRENVSGKLLGFNYSKDKALIEVNVGGVPLTEECFHIVLQRRKDGWKFFSVRRITVS